jgi:hypothetical protein
MPTQGLILLFGIVKILQLLAALFILRKSKAKTLGHCPKPHQGRAPGPVKNPADLGVGEEKRFTNPKPHYILIRRESTHFRGISSTRKNRAPAVFHGWVDSPQGFYSRIESRPLSLKEKLVKISKNIFFVLLFLLCYPF